LILVNQRSGFLITADEREDEQRNETGSSLMRVDLKKVKGLPDFAGGKYLFKTVKI